MVSRGFSPKMGPASKDDARETLRSSISSPPGLRQKLIFRDSKLGISKGYLHDSRAVKTTPVATLQSSAQAYPKDITTHKPTIEATTSAICNLHVRDPIKHAPGLATTAQAVKNTTIQNTSARRANIKHAAWSLDRGGLTSPTGSLCFAATPWMRT